MEAIAALDYRPNISARNLRRGRTGIIALAVPELDTPYFAELARHVVSAAARHDWTVLIDQTNGDPEQERLVASGIRDHMIDGLIFSPLALAGADLDVGAKATPMVLLGERIDHGPADHVAIDNVAAARDITAHLVARGCRRIAAIGAQHTAEAATARLGWPGTERRCVRPASRATMRWSRRRRSGTVRGRGRDAGAARRRPTTGRRVCSRHTGAGRDAGAARRRPARTGRRRGRRVRRHRGRPFSVPTLTTVARQGRNSHGSLSTCLPLGSRPPTPRYRANRPCRTADSARKHRPALRPHP